MILTALRNYVHELAKSEPEEKAEEFDWDNAEETLPIKELIKLYLNKSVLEIEFKESKDKN